VQHTALTTVPAFTLAEGFVLVSWWKAILVLIPFVPWAWVVSRVLDKHAARFFLPREAWNVAHLCAGLLAILAALFMPFKGEGAFWAGLGAMIVILLADIVIFALVTNKDERVPEKEHLRLDFSSFTRAREAKKVAKEQGQVALTIKGPDKAIVAPPAASTPEFAVRVAAESVVLKAMGMRSGQVEFIPTGKDGAYGAAYIVDGVRQPGDTMPGADALKVMDFWKGAAKLDLADRRKKLVGDINIEWGEAKRKLRVSSIGGQGGMRVTLLIDPEGQVRRKAAALGLLEPQIAALKEIVDDGKGLVLLAAPSDGGRTTTLYTIVKMHDAYTKNVQTLEFDIQDALEGIRQNKFDPQAEGAEFATVARSIIRRDPDVVGIAELPDAASAKELAKADGERTRIYVSMRTDSALAAVGTWAKAVGEPDLASKNLRGVVAQRLVRKLCTNCRVAYQPSPDMTKKLGLPAGSVKQLFKKGGEVLVKDKPQTCPMCAGVGYVGQEGVFEVFPFGDAERAMLKASNLNGLKLELRKRNLPTIQQAALRKAIDGITSVEEVMRVTADASAAAPTTPTAPASPGPAAARKA